jgi:hypothetical protein
MTGPVAIQQVSYIYPATAPIRAATVLSDATGRLGGGAAPEKCWKRCGLLRLLPDAAAGAATVPAPLTPSDSHLTNPPLSDSPSSATGAGPAPVRSARSTCWTGLWLLVASRRRWRWTAAWSATGYRPTGSCWMRCGVCCCTLGGFDARDASPDLARPQAQSEGAAAGDRPSRLPAVPGVPAARARPGGRGLDRPAQAVRGWFLGQDRATTRLVWADARAAHRLMRHETTPARTGGQRGLRPEPSARPPAPRPAAHPT